MFVLHEPTFDGLLSAFAWCLRRKDASPVFFADTDQPVLLPVQPVAAEPGIRALFQRHFGRRLGEAAGKAVLETVYTAYLSEQDGLSAHLYRYLYLALDMKRDPGALLQDRSVAAVVQAARRRAVRHTSTWDFCAFAWCTISSTWLSSPGLPCAAPDFTSFHRPPV
jgi:hypothetical protein